MAQDKIKVWRTVKRGFLFPINQPGGILKIVAVPTAAWLLLSLALAVVLLPGDAAARESLSTWILILCFPIYVPAMARAYRLILLREKAEHVTFGDYADRRTIRLFAASLLLVAGIGACVMFVILPSVFLGAALGGEKAAALTILPAVLLAVLLAFTLVARYVLVLPNVAVGSPLKLREVVRLGRGNRLRIVWISLLVQLPFHIVDPLASAAIHAGSAMNFLPISFLAFSAICAGAVQIHAQSDMYRELLIMEKLRRDEAAETAAPI